MNKHQINKIFFLIHPVCWAAAYEENQSPANSLENEFLALYQLEKKVRQKQNVFIENMKEDELLILYPIYVESKAMQNLQKFAQAALGERCIILDFPMPDPTSIKNCLPDYIMLELSKEVAEFLVLNNWCDRCSGRYLKVLFFNRAYAYELDKEFKKRRFEIDPMTVECEAFGEGFAQCAMTWKGMLPHYLGWAKPIENSYELSVSGAPFLTNAVYKERIAIKDDIRLFLWEGARRTPNTPIGLFARASFKLSDPQYFARVTKEAFHFEIRNVSCELKWPFINSENASVQPIGNFLDVAVHEGGRKYFSDDILYIIGKDVSYEQFKKVMTRVSVIEKNGEG